MHDSIYNIVGAAIAFTKRCAYHRRIREDWCVPLLIDNASENEPINVVIEIAKRLHLSGSDVRVAQLLRTMEEDTRQLIMKTLRCQGIELAGPDVFIK